jgi:hypothetical protein
MFDHSRLTRVITLALASCAVTWALAGSALARPDDSAQSPGATSTAPAFKPVPGDTDKAPSAQAPAYKGVNADANKTPNAAQVDRVLNGINNKNPQPVVNGGDDTGTIALIVAIAAILTALGAVTLTVTRTHRPMMGA